MKRNTAILILVALTLGIYVGNAARPALVDESDCGHAIAAREILESGDWAVLHINGIRWLEKPPLLYWIGAATYSVLGETAFTTRLPLAMETVALVLLLFAFGRRWFGERAGFYAGLVMCTSMGTFFFTRTMIPEILYALEFTGIFYLFLRAWQGTLSPRIGYWGAAALTALATLTRGLVGVIFPVAVILLFLMATGGWRRWKELPLISAALIFLAIAAPWHVVAGARAPGFYWFYFINEHFLRAIGARFPMDYKSVPLLLWWGEHLLWFFPWSFFLPFAIQEFPRPAMWNKPQEGPERSPHANTAEAKLLLFLWAGFILIFFSLTARMEYYSFGAWSAIALLLGLGLVNAEEERSPWLPRLQGALAAAGVLVAGALTTLVWMSRNVPAARDISSLLNVRPEAYYKSAMANFTDLTVRAFAALRGPAIAAAIALGAGLFLAWVLRRQGRALAATIALALSASGFLFAANGAFEDFEPYLSSRALAEHINTFLRPDDRILLYGDFYGGCTVSFYTHRKLWIWNGRYYGLEFGSNYADAPRIFLTDEQFPAFWNGPHRVFLVVPLSHRREAILRLPKDSTYLLATSGGKAVYTNQPVKPDQPLIEQSVRNKSGGAPDADKLQGKH